MKNTIILSALFIFSLKAFAGPGIKNGSALPSFPVLKNAIETLTYLSDSPSYKDLKTQKSNLIKASKGLTIRYLYETGEVVDQPYVRKINTSKDSVIEDINALSKWSYSTINSLEKRFDYTNTLVVKTSYSGIKLKDERHGKDSYCTADSYVSVLETGRKNYIFAECNDAEENGLSSVARIGVTRNFKLLINGKVIGVFDPLDKDQVLTHQFKSSYLNTEMTLQIKAKLSTVAY